VLVRVLPLEAGSVAPLYTTVKKLQAKAFVPSSCKLVVTWSLLLTALNLMVLCLEITAPLKMVSKSAGCPTLFGTTLRVFL